MHDFLANPLVRGALSGALAAAVVDLHAFREWKTFYEFTNYNWGVAAFRWFQGGVMGAFAAAGLGSLL